MSMLVLKYTREQDKFMFATVMGDPESIRDLYWQLTHNYKSVDGTEIGEITVTNLAGHNVTDDFQCNPYCHAATSNLR